MKEVEEAYIRLVLARTQDNRRQAAQILGISLHTLYNKLGQFQMREKDLLQTRVRGSATLTERA
jgi:DNA-binding NtrC family response regulator